MNYEIAMEGLQDLPIFNETVIKVEKPDKKWPGFPQTVSAISSMMTEVSNWLDPSCVLRMGNIITLEDLEENEDYQALLDDLKEGCSVLGTVVSMHVPRIHVKCICNEWSIAWRRGCSWFGLCIHSVYDCLRSG